MSAQYKRAAAKNWSMRRSWRNTVLFPGGTRRPDTGRLRAEADNDDVYAFAWLHYAQVSVGRRF